ncbi:MAG: hypothetical protein WDO71_01860 [Bacteroidota bacterium]
MKQFILSCMVAACMLSACNNNKKTVEATSEDGKEKVTVEMTPDATSRRRNEKAIGRIAKITPFKS